MKRLLFIAALVLIPWQALAVELDADSNGYQDLDKGGTNAATEQDPVCSAWDNTDIVALWGAGTGLLKTDGTVDTSTYLTSATVQAALEGLVTLDLSGLTTLTLPPAIDSISMTMDPSYWYDQSATYRTVPIMLIGDNYPNGITITEWAVKYVDGDPTTELDADLVCDTTPDFNPAAGATVMDVLDTTTGASTANTGFDSATCANGSRLYIRFGADPADANVIVAFDLWLKATAAP